MSEDTLTIDAKSLAKTAQTLTKALEDAKATLAQAQSDAAVRAAQDTARAHQNLGMSVTVTHILVGLLIFNILGVALQIISICGVK